MTWTDFAIIGLGFIVGMGAVALIETIYHKRRR